MVFDGIDLNDLEVAGRDPLAITYWLEDRILLHVPRKGGIDDAATAGATGQVLERIFRAHDGKLSVVVLLDQLAGQDSGARRIHSQTPPTLCRGVALVANSMLGRAIGSFFLGLAKSETPTCMCGSIAEARTWCRAQRADAGAAGRAAEPLLHAPSGGPSEATLTASEVERIGNALCRMATLDPAPELLARNHQGDAADVLAYQINETAAEIRRLVRDLEQSRLELHRAQKAEAFATIAAGVAHNFNNLLTAIVGYTGFARASLPTAHQAHGDLDEVESAAGRAMSLITQLSAINSAIISTEDEELAVNELIDATMPALARETQPPVELRRELQDDVWAIGMPESALVHALTCVFRNGVEASSGASVIHVRTRNVPASDATGLDLSDGDYVAIEIEDSGRGMSARTRERCRDPFFTTKSMARHPGLGLTAASGLVARAGGHLHIQSREGDGTIVTLAVPRSAPAASG